MNYRNPDILGSTMSLKLRDAYKIDRKVNPSFHITPDMSKLTSYWSSYITEN